MDKSGASNRGKIEQEGWKRRRMGTLCVMHFRCMLRKSDGTTEGDVKEDERGGRREQG